jgi:predicted nuclease of restriction endonuclease-like (RecB) superfamily
VGSGEIDESQYLSLFSDIKDRIARSQLRAAISLNQVILDLYWTIGRAITQQQKRQAWGDAVIDRLSKDLCRAFPYRKGFSKSNLFRMRQFYLAYPQVGICRTAVRQIPWSQNVVILARVQNQAQRVWYAEQSLRCGWSRNVLEHQIATDLYRRQTQRSKDHNFSRTLPSPQSDLAAEMLKDPYHFDFLGLGVEIRERELENALILHLQEFLLELGVGFAFIGRQYVLEVGGEEYKVDLLFYHLKLRSLVAIDLKMEAFRPEHAGKMNFYLSALDDLVRYKLDSPSIGIILCREKSRTTVEYSLRDTSKPIGVSAYKLTSTLPNELEGTLPTSVEFERSLRMK